MENVKGVGEKYNLIAVMAGILQLEVGIFIACSSSGGRRRYFGLAARFANLHARVICLAKVDDKNILHATTLLEKLLLLVVRAIGVPWGVHVDHVGIRLEIYLVLLRMSDRNGHDGALAQEGKDKAALQDACRAARHGSLNLVALDRPWRIHLDVSGCPTIRSCE